ncbi:MAG: putative metal-binding motif-containing protein [Alphaproteobacteria bacterium]|nr:putative metal-binding motif-containing protein [Alphaproteobacteria bacterium]MCB9796841.1 putative metal-binding motif-containing protein [Alphaproteobacteria bacterium]
MPALVLLLLACNLTKEPAPDSRSSDDSAAPDSHPIDGDGDGWAAGEDCDDADDAVHPGAEEVCGDGVVNDCDGSAELALEACRHQGTQSLGTLGLLLDGADVETAGFKLAVADLDGDGQDDLALSGITYGEDDRGAVYVLRGPISSGAELAEHPDLVARLEGGEARCAGADGLAGELGYGLEAIDLDGDGALELVLAANGDGVYVFPGNTVGEEDLSRARSCVGVAEAGQYVGAPTAVGHWDGDIYGDLAVGNSSSDVLARDAGQAWVFYGGQHDWTQDLDVADADLSILGAGASDRLAQVHDLGDIDGDGVDELAASAWGYREADDAGPDRGAIFIFFDDLTGAVSRDDADLALTGNAPRDDLSHAQAFLDPEGSGNGYVALGAGSFDCDDAEGCGAVWLLTDAASTPSGEIDSALPLRIEGEHPGEGLGSELEVLPNFDGDGAPTLVLGARTYGSSGAATAGRVYLLPMDFPENGVLNAEAEATLILEGTGTDHWTGRALAAGDLNGDSLSDLVVGFPGRLGVIDGGAWLVLGQGI